MMLAALLALAFPQAIPQVTCLGERAEKVADARQRHHGKGLWIGGIAFAAEDIASAKAIRDRYTNEPIVDISFTPSGQAKFARAQACRLYRKISVWLDDALISQATLPGPILGSGFILQGSFTDESARALASRLSPLTPNTGP